MAGISGYNLCTILSKRLYMQRIITMLIGCLWLSLTARAEPVPEYVMKATYLYNFALYTEWPASVGDTINLCVLGHEEFGSALDAINGKQVNNLSLNISRVSSTSNLKLCQMVFIGEGEANNAQKILDVLGDAPVLTVTEGPAPLHVGVIVSMVVEDRKLVFHINASAARRAKLNISSKLLRLARSVY